MLVRNLYRSSYVILLIISVAGCVRTPPSSPLPPEQWKKAQNHQFEGVSKKALFDAVVRLFKLLDGDDIEFVRTESSLTVNHLVDQDLTGRYFSKHHWLFLIENETGEKLRASVRVRRSFRHVNVELITGIPQGTGFPPNAGSIAVYEMFWARVNYLLNRSKHWPTCGDVKTKYANSNNANISYLEALCSLFYDQKTPIGDQS